MTQSDALLEMLLRGETVTPAIAFSVCGSLACHSRMSELRPRLRAMGLRLEMRMRSDGGKRWGEYKAVPLQVELAL